jgi:hypothetical protein
MRRKKKLKLKAYEGVVHSTAAAGCLDMERPEYVGESRASYFLYESGLITIMDELFEEQRAVDFWAAYSHGD